MVGLKYGFRSGLEEKIAEQILEQEGEVEYEAWKLCYTQPEKGHTYKPDFRLKNGIFVETKGRFVLADRQKHLWIRQQHPEWDIRFVFTNSKAKLRKGSNTSYGDWCLKHGFQYADKQIPGEWFYE